MPSVIIAKINSICPISGKISYSVLNEGKFSLSRRSVEEYSLLNCSPDEAEVRIAKRHKASLVSEEEFEDFLSLFEAEDKEKIARQSSIHEKREEERFYASLTGIRLKIYNDLGLDGTEWKRAARAIDEEFVRRYSAQGPLGHSAYGRSENGWQPLGG